MPNHVTNNLRLSGDKREIDRLLKTIAVNKIGTIDFELIEIE